MTIEDVWKLSSARQGAIELVAAGAMDGTVLRPVHVPHLSALFALLQELHQLVMGTGAAPSVLSGAAVAQIHDALLAIALRAVPGDTLLAEEVALRHLLAIDVVQQIEVRQVLMQRLHLLRAAATCGAVEGIAFAVGRQRLEARGAHAVEAGQHLHLVAALIERRLVQGLHAHHAVHLRLRQRLEIVKKLVNVV